MQEVLHVVMAYAIVYPRAMMVHFKHAEVTLAAMVRSGWLPSFLSIALLAILDLHILTLKGWLQTFRNASRVCKGRP